MRPTYSPSNPRLAKRKAFELSNKSAIEAHPGIVEPNTVTINVTIEARNKTDAAIKPTKVITLRGLKLNPTSESRANAIIFLEVYLEVPANLGALSMGNGIILYPKLGISNL